MFQYVNHGQTCKRVQVDVFVRRTGQMVKESRNIFLRVNLRRNGSHVLHAKLYLIFQHFGQKCKNNKDIFIFKDRDI